MRTIITSLTLAVSALLLSCNKNNPKDVAREWLTDFYHQDYESAKKISTEETRYMLNTIQGFSAALDDSVKEKAKKVTIDIKDVKVEGDKATVTFRASNAPTQDEPPLKLVKQNDKWMVQFTKSDFKPEDTNQPEPGVIFADPTPAASAPAQPDATMAPDTSRQQPTNTEK
jgi:hypothetical protein